MKRQLRARRKVVNSKIKHQRASRCIEAMEQRCLLTTLYGGGLLPDAYYSNTFDPAVNTYYYKGADNTVVEVTLGGRITAEFIWAKWNAAANPPAPALFDQPAATTAAQVVADGQGGDLFAIYVTKQAPPDPTPTLTDPYAPQRAAWVANEQDLDSFITITATAVNTANGKITIHPFEDSVGQLRVTSSQNGQLVQVNSGLGKVYLGARTQKVGNANNDNIPVIALDWVNPQQANWGVMPATPSSMVTVKTDPLTGLPVLDNSGQPILQIHAGLTVADGQNLGKFLFGGTVTGQVTVGGSMDTFYAGMLLTGDATGAGGYPTLTTGTYTTVYTYHDKVVDNTTGQTILDTTTTSPYTLITYSKPADNFVIKGDLRNLVVNDGIGTDSDAALDKPVYITGFQMRVDGRLGQVKTNDSLVGTVDVQVDQGLTQDNLAQQEVESRGHPYNYVNVAGAGPQTYGYPLDYVFTNGYLVAPNFYNDSFNTAQYLGTIHSNDLQQDNVVQVQGTLEGTDAKDIDATWNKYRDYTDYYAVGLLAGQTVQVQLSDLYYLTQARYYINYYTQLAQQWAQAYPGSPNPYAGYADTYKTMPVAAYGLSVGVFDPDGRLIASDVSDVDPTSTEGQPFRFTADRPGAYRFVVGLYGDDTFSTGNGSNNIMVVRTVESYELTIKNVGNVTLGGVSATNNIFDPAYDWQGFNVAKGDLGALYAGGTILSDGKDRMPYDMSAIVPGQVAPEMPYGVQVKAGNLRCLDGNAIGIRTNTNALIEGMDINVPVGTVGLVRSRTGILVLNDYWNYLGGIYAGNAEVYKYQMTPYTYTYNYTLGGHNYTETYDDTYPQGNYQYVVLPGVGLDYQLVDAGGTLYGNVIANRKIGVIRAGDMNTLSASTFMANADGKGDDGIIDLIDVTGNFGSAAAGGPHITTGRNGNVRYIHVGGTVYRDSLFGSGSPLATQYPAGKSATITDDSGSIVTLKPSGGGAWSLLTYGIRGAGGSVIVSVNCTNSSLTVTGAANKAGGTAEIGSINLGTGGTLTVNGTAKVDVFSVTATGTYPLINNVTAGELVNLSGAYAVRVTAQTLGFSRPMLPQWVSTAKPWGNPPGLTLDPYALAINPKTVLGFGYPFNQQRTAINVARIDSVLVRGAVGNINATTLGQVTANSDNVHTKGYTGLEGIVGPIYASGNITSVSIGEGIPSAGAGNLALAGIFAGGTIGKVTGINADIYGAVAAVRGITSVQLTNGSLINATIWQGILSDARRIILSKSTIGAGGGTLINPVYEVGSVTVTGSATYKGGIIGSLIWGSDIGTLRVVNGFGIVNSSIATGGNGVIDRIEADGLGLRLLTIGAGARINTILANGAGQLLSIKSFAPAVRKSENPDPNAAMVPTRVTDLYVFFNEEYAGSSLVPVGKTNVLDPTAKTPAVQGVTNAGMITGVSAAASRDLGLLQGWRLEGGPPAIATTTTTMPGINPLPVSLPTPVAGSLLKPGYFTFANSIKTIKIAQDLQDVQIVTGTLSSLSVGRNVVGGIVTVAGPIGSILINGNVDQDSTIQAIGWNGQIGTLTITGKVFGTISATYKIGRKNAVLGKNLDGTWGSITVG